MLFFPKIRKVIRKAPRHRVKHYARITKFKYPKLLYLTLSIAIAYFLFKQPTVLSFISGLNNLNYLGVFLAGIFFSFGFSTPFAVGYFITTHPDNLLLAAILGGFGAMFSDLFMYKFIKFSFMKEFKALEKEKHMKKVIHFFHTSKRVKIKTYLLYAFSGIVIASPLPDEVGVAMLAGMTSVSSRVIAIIGFSLSTLGIYIMLNI